MTRKALLTFALWLAALLALAAPGQAASRHSRSHHYGHHHYGHRHYGHRHYGHHRSRHDRDDFGRGKHHHLYSNGGPDPSPGSVGHYLPPNVFYGSSLTAAPPNGFPQVKNAAVIQGHVAYIVVTTGSLTTGTPTTIHGQKILNSHSATLSASAAYRDNSVLHAWHPVPLLKLDSRSTTFNGPYVNPYVRYRTVNNVGDWGKLYVTAYGDEVITSGVYSDNTPQEIIIVGAAHRLRGTRQTRHRRLLGHKSHYTPPNAAHRKMPAVPVTSHYIPPN